MKIFISGFLLFLIPSCAMDYSSSSHIVNSSDQNINVSIIYDREKLDSLYNYRKGDYIKYLRRLNEESGVAFKFDSLKLTSDYILPINKSLRVDYTFGGSGVTPNHSIIKEITVKSNDKTTVYNHLSLDTAFKRINNATWELTIR